MIAQLTRTERRVAMVIAALLALLGLTMAGLAMAGLANHDPMAVQGFMALGLGVGLVFAVGGVLEEPVPDPARMQHYYDDPIKVGIVAALMVWPDATFAQAWSGYGRLRPVHTTGGDLCPCWQCADSDLVPRHATHLSGAAALPVSWTGAKSYPAFSGVQDAMVQWWYGHNAVAFFMTSGFLGIARALITAAGTVTHRSRPALPLLHGWRGAPKPQGSGW